MAEELDRKSDAQRTVRLMSELLESKGWKELVQAAHEQIKNRRGKHLVGPLKEGMSIYAQQFELGEAAGIELFTKIPLTLLEGSRAVLEEIKASEPKPNGSEKPAAG